jgi:hypothetical protein
MQLLMGVIMEAFDGRFLDGSVHPLDLSVGPGVVRSGEPMLDVVGFTDHVEAHLARPCGVAVAGLIGELDAIIGQDRIGYGMARLSVGIPGTSKPFACQPCRPVG